MIRLPRTTWHYAILLIFLLTIASGAALSTILYLDGVVDAGDIMKRQEIVQRVTIMIWALTMGFMLIAGAFGLWAIHFSGESESRRRVSEVVDGMDYLSDGLLVVDRRGRVTGCNPALRAMIDQDVSQDISLVKVFPCLTDEDVKVLLSLSGPNEVQRDGLSDGGKRTLRFRSQTAGGMLSLILVSDITTMTVRALRAQQTARLQVIGRIARGVAHDFSNVLSGISGHASLISRLKPGTQEMQDSLATITRESERGALLAGHLLEFSHVGVSGEPTDKLGEHVKKASDLVRVGLSDVWRVETDVEENLPVVPLSGLQVEQIILNLGIVAADALQTPGSVRITASKPSKGHLLNVDDTFAAVIVVSSARTGDSKVWDALHSADYDVRTTDDESGVVQSLVRSLVEEAGGSLDCFAGAGQSRIYRIVLPYGTVQATAPETEEITEELQSYVSHWQVLLARGSSDHDVVEDKLRENGVGVYRVDNVMSALARVEDGTSLNAIVLERNLLGDEADGLLRAIIKLCPAAGIVVLCEDPGSEPEELSRDIVFESGRAGAGRVVKAMVEAKGLAARRI